MHISIHVDTDGCYFRAQEFEKYYFHFPFCFWEVQSATDTKVTNKMPYFVVSKCLFSTDKTNRCTEGRRMLFVTVLLVILNKILSGGGMKHKVGL